MFPGSCVLPPLIYSQGGKRPVRFLTHLEKEESEVQREKQACLNSQSASSMLDVAFLDSCPLCTFGRHAYPEDSGPSGSFFEVREGMRESWHGPTNGISSPLKIVKTVWKDLYFRSRLQEV